VQEVHRTLIHVMCELIEENVESAVEGSHA